MPHPGTHTEKNLEDAFARPASDSHSCCQYLFQLSQHIRRVKDENSPDRVASKGSAGREASSTAVVETDRLLQLTECWESPVSLSKLPRVAGQLL